MSRIVFAGGGMVGSCAAMMLANDGHQVTVLERDPAPAPPVDQAWDRWERRGVNQFRLSHFLLARFRQVADAELPGLTDAMTAAGALRTNPMREIPEQFSGGWRAGDERFELVTARRPVAEAVVGAAVAATPGLTMRRGTAVRDLVTERGNDGTVHVAGVVTDDGERIDADLVVDSGGRRTSVPAHLRAAGSPGPVETVADSGLVYYARHFRSADGSIPPAFGPALQHYGSISALTLAADNGTWGVVLVASSRDAALRPLSDPDVWTRTVRGFPLVAHWLDAEPFGDMLVMTKIEDRLRRYVVDGAPVATGIVPLADAWGCTNPSLGRGISLGLVHAAALRRLVRDEPLTDARRVALRWDELTAETVAPLLDETFALDRGRLADVEAAIAGRPPTSDDPRWLLQQALTASALRDPDLLRASIDTGMLLTRIADVQADAELTARAHALADPTPPPGPDRAQLLALVGA